VLFYAPAALGGSSALRAWGLRRHGDSDDGPIRVCVDGRRSVRSRPGITVERVGGWKGRTQLHLSPPRLRLEHAARSSSSTAGSAMRRRWTAGRDAPFRLMPLSGGPVTRVPRAVATATWPVAYGRVVAALFRHGGRT